MDSHPYVRLGLDRQGFMIFEHRIVMEKHIGGPLAAEEIVHHLNGNTRDNRLENLEVTTVSAHRALHNTKLNSISVRQIRELEKEEHPRWAIAVRFGVTTTTIGHIINGWTWTHVH